MNDKYPVVATVRRWVDALVAGDWDALADTLAADHRFEDRRLGMKSTLDKAGSIQQARVIADLGRAQQFQVDLDIIEVRGDRLALVRQVYRSSSYEVSVLAVTEVDDSGLTRVFIVFDEDDLRAARAELEALSGASF